MDKILTDFIQQTRVEPSLAHDLLEATEWNVDDALLAYESLKDTRAVDPPEYQYNPRDFELSSKLQPQQSSVENDHVDFDSEELRCTVGCLDANVDENEAERREVLVKKRKKVRHSRGLSFKAADEVMKKFNEMAITKQKVSSKEQVTIDEKFFRDSFMYPDFSHEDQELQQYISNDLLEVSHKKALECSGRLNWWTSMGRLPSLEPLATSGDGNCLLHAASLYMWGFHDHFLILRTALHRILTAGLEKEGLKRRWRYQTQLRNNEAGGLIFSEEEWMFEWGEILRIATNKPRRQPNTDSLRRYSSLRFSYESLEEIHIFVLAHTLRRPVIVISDRTVKDQHGQDLAPIYFGGIYLPLEVNPTACYKSPVVLAYDSSHFSSLVARQVVLEMDKKQQQKAHSKHAWTSDRKETVIPLVTPDGSLLPVQFIYDPTKKDVQEKWSKMDYEVGEFPDDIVQFLESYLNIRWIQLKVPAATSHQGCSDSDSSFPIQAPKVRFPVAKITQEVQPMYQRELVEKYLDHIKTQYQEEKERKANWKAEREEEERKKLQNMAVPCKGVGCDMFGRPATHNLCSICYQKMLVVAEDAREYGEDRGVIGGRTGQHRYDEEEADDRVNMHHNLTIMPPSSSPHSQHVQRSADHVKPLRQYGESSGASEAPQGAMGGDMLPVYDIGQSTHHAASPGTPGDQSKSKSLSSLKHAQMPLEERPVTSAGNNIAKPGSQMALNVGNLSPNRKVMQGQCSTPSPTHPPSSPATSPSGGYLPHLVPKVTDISATSRSAPPLGLKKEGIGGGNERNAPPPFPLVDDDDDTNTGHFPEHTDPEHTDSSQASNSNFKTAATCAQGSGGEYARDKIQSLHLNPTQQISIGHSSGIGSSTRNSCMTQGCHFFGSAKTRGYCSSCNKKQQQKGTGSESYV